MANGDFGVVLDNFVDYDVRGGYPNAIHISGNVYAVACQGTGQDGWVHTFTVDSAGLIAGALIDSFEFANGVFLVIMPSMIHISGEYYAITYKGPGNDGWLCTVRISDAGAITNAVIDTLEFDGNYCERSKIIHVSGDIFAIVYQGSGVDGYVVTVEISTTGIIPAAVTDGPWEFDAVRGANSDIIKIAGTTYAIVYSGTAGVRDGVVFSLTIADNGTITPAVIDSLTFDVDCWYPRILHVSGDVYAIAFVGTTNLSVVTVEITSAGAIPAIVIDTLVVDIAANESYSLSFLNVAGEIFVVAYTGTANHGYIASLSITAGGAISGAILDSLEYYGAGLATNPSVVVASSSVLVVVYTAAGDGDISTIAITAISLPTVTTDVATGVT